jgi:hypothetical protein
MKKKISRIDHGFSMKKKKINKCGFVLNLITLFIIVIFLLAVIFSDFDF